MINRIKIRHVYFTSDVKRGWTKVEGLVVEMVINNVKIGMELVV